MNTQPRLARHGRRGFTLAELMVVIVIIGLLATVVVPNVVRRLFTGQRTKAAADITAIAAAIDTYAVENMGKYPDSLEVLVTPDENGHTFLDRESVPLDPWGNPYDYQPAAPGQAKFRVICYGKDGQPGGEGDDEDFDNVSIKNQGK